VTFQPSVRVVTFASALAIALAVAVSISALAPMRATAGELFAYRSEAGRFSVDFPAESPSVEELSGSKFSITDNDVRHAVFAEGAEFAVEIHDIPFFAEFLLTSHYILERSVQGLFEDIGAREVDSAEISVHGQPAREVAFEIPDRAFTGRVLLVLAGRRLYLVSVQHPRSIDPPDAVAPFFESFSFWLE
jgi:hypothetical protein